jgi:hypothetical protein
MDMQRPLVSAVVGARPNFMKMAPILEEICKRGVLAARLIHTGQHYSAEMSDTFFQELGMPKPDINLEVRGSSHTTQTAGVMLSLEAELNANRPDLLLVVGDVNSTMAAALVGAKLGAPSLTWKRVCEAATAACPKKSTGWLPTRFPTTSLPANQAAPKTFSPKASHRRRHFLPATS